MTDVSVFILLQHRIYLKNPLLLLEEEEEDNDNEDIKAKITIRGKFTVN